MTTMITPEQALEVRANWYKGKRLRPTPGKFVPESTIGFGSRRYWRIRDPDYEVCVFDDGEVYVYKRVKVDHFFVTPNPEKQPEGD